MVLSAAEFLYDLLFVYGSRREECHELVNLHFYVAPFAHRSRPITLLHGGYDLPGSRYARSKKQVFTRFNANLCKSPEISVGVSSYELHKSKT